MFKNILDLVKNGKCIYIIVTIVLIVIFEFFIDIPKFKKADMKRDAGVTIIMNIGLIAMAIAIFVIKKIR